MPKGKGRAIQRVEIMFQNVHIISVKPDEYDKARIAELHKNFLNYRPVPQLDKKSPKKSTPVLDYQI